MRLVCPQIGAAVLKGLTKRAAVIDARKDRSRGRTELLIFPQHFPFFKTLARQSRRCCMCVRSGSNALVLESRTPQLRAPQHDCRGGGRPLRRRAVAETAGGGVRWGAIGGRQIFFPVRLVELLTPIYLSGPVLL